MSRGSLLIANTIRIGIVGELRESARLTCPGGSVKQPEASLTRSA